MPTKPTTSARTAGLRERAETELQEIGAQQEHRPVMADLYRRAEAQVQKQRKQQRAGAGVPKSETDAQRLLHELQVHQVELEMQNAELQKARDELEVSLEKYTDLYDFAPVGYFTLAPDGLIQLVNLTGTQLVGIERSPLMGRSFGLLIAAELRPAFHSFLKQVFASPAKQSRDFELLRPGHASRAVNLEAQRSPNGDACRVTVADITERKLVEEKVRESEERFRVMANAMSQMAWIARPDGHIFWYNQRWYDYTGTTPKQMEGWGWQSVHDPAVLPNVLKRWRQSLATGTDFEMTFPLRGADGLFRPFLTRVVPLKDAAGRVVQWLGTNTDVEAQQRAEEEVRVSEVRYRRLFEAAHDGVLLLDPGTRKITDANPFMTKLLGYPNNQLVGKELFEIGLLKDEVASREMFQKLKRKREVRYEDLPLESREGRHQEVEVVANLYQENGHSVIQCNIRDITQRKQAEEVLRRNEALFSALMEQAPVGVYVVDARLRLLQVNPKARPVFKNVHPLIGRDFSKVIHVIWPRQVADQILKRFRHTLKTGEPYQAPEFAARRRDTGTKEIYEWQIQRVILPAGEHAVVCFFNNITERKQAEQTRRRLDVLTASNRKLEQEIVRRQAVEESLQRSERHQSKLLEQSDLMQEELRKLSRQVLWAQEEERKRISRELHDVIAQTLTGINIRLAGLKISAASDPGKLDQEIARTQRLVEHSVRIIHQFARELRPAVLDDLGLIPALQTHLKHFKAETGIRVSLSAWPEIEQASGDKRTALYRVAQEALTNIARHAKVRRAEVNIRMLHDTVCMTIQDGGKGFKEEGGLRGNKKSRLGMIGMRERVEMVGGNLKVQSAPGKGTTIRVQIPLANARGGGT